MNINKIKQLSEAAENRSLDTKWIKFEKYVRKTSSNKRYKDEESGDFDFNTYYKGVTIDADFKKYFSKS